MGYHKTYQEARDAAKALVREHQAAFGLEKCDPILTGGRFRVFRLPARAWREGFELRCESFEVEVYGRG